ncbi:MAG: ribonuclease HI [Desulfobacterales bacterium]|nr:ribonuclease HI [Desulfobacterales bacterium]
MTDAAKKEGRNPQWIRMSFKDNKVWVETGEDGTPIEKDNKVRIKYNLMQDHEYWINKESLKPEEQALPAGAKERKPRKKKAKPLDLSQLPVNCIRIFTDGASSGNPGPSGIGILLQYQAHEKKISKSIGRATNNTAELTAIQQGLLALKRRDLPVRIFTDSKYAMDVLTGAKKAGTHKELVGKIQELMGQFKDIDFIKVKAHAGIKENEVADYLAVSAIEK